MEEIFDVIVIGAGPGGYTAAIKAAKEGLHTAIIEKERVGGTCLNRGCIPAKTMIYMSSLYREMKEKEMLGILSAGVRYDYRKILEYKEHTIDRLCSGVEHLLKLYGVTVIRGKGILEKNRRVKVISETGEKSYGGKHIILAAGAKPRILSNDFPKVMTSDELFQLERVPESILIIGGGIIGTEFAGIFVDLGSKVTIIETCERLLPNMDREISRNLELILRKRGIEIHTLSSVQCIEQDIRGYTCVFNENGKLMETSARFVLCAVGRHSNVENLFTEEAEPLMDEGYIAVDQNFCTSIKGVYAIGDLIKGKQLAHLASAQGICVADKIAGRKISVDLRTIPECVYTNPEIASVGLTEDEAKKQGIDIRVGKFNMNVNGKSIISGGERGFIKVLVENETDMIIGAQMMCERATDMIGEFVTAIVNQMTAKQLIRGVRAHPTYNEGVSEALKAASQNSIYKI